MSFETVDAFLLLQQKRLTDVLLYDSFAKSQENTSDAILLYLVKTWFQKQRILRNGYHEPVSNSIHKKYPGTNWSKKKEKSFPVLDISQLSLGYVTRPLPSESCQSSFVIGQNLEIYFYSSSTEYCSQEFWANFQLLTMLPSSTAQ